MTAYGYEAVDASGRVVKGAIEAETLEAARNALKSQGLVPTTVGEQSVMNRDINIDLSGKPKPRELAVWCRQFVAMTKAGVSILEALKLLGDQTENKKLQKATNEVRASVEKGQTLAGSLSEHPNVFPELLVNLVSAGEASGSLDNSLERSATQFEKTAKINGMVSKAMIYPVMVLIVALAVIVVMLLVVVPRYESMFKELGGELPGITVAVVNASNFLKNYWFIVFPVIILLVLLIKAWSKTDSGKHVLHKIILHFPAFGKLEKKKACSLMARTLSSLLSSGVPMVEAVEIVSQTMTNVYYEEALVLCKEGILIGQPLSRPMQECGLFPPMVYHMTRIGEESGDTEGMLTKLADYYDEEVEQQVQATMAALEPMIIVLLAGAVGFLVAACMAPMLEMYNSLNNL